jgi:hypothetical protein
VVLKDLYRKWKDLSRILKDLYRERKDLSCIPPDLSRVVNHLNCETNIRLSQVEGRAEVQRSFCGKSF